MPAPFCAPISTAKVREGTRSNLEKRALFVPKDSGRTKMEAATAVRPLLVLPRIRAREVTTTKTKTKNRLHRFLYKTPQPHEHEQEQTGAQRGPHRNQADVLACIIRLFKHPPGCFALNGNCSGTCFKPVFPNVRTLLCPIFIYVLVRVVSGTE